MVHLALAGQLDSLRIVLSLRVKRDSLRDGVLQLERLGHIVGSSRVVCLQAQLLGANKIILHYHDSDHGWVVAG